MLTVWKDSAAPFPRLRARRGNVAITFALATMPIVGFVGFAVDYSHANSVKAAMQAALDSTALMLSKDGRDRHQRAAADQAPKYFKALFTRAGSHRALRSPPPTPPAAARRSWSTASADVPTNFIGIIGLSTT